MKNLFLKTFSLCLLLFINISVHAQTNVSGFILSNTTWSTGGNPYHVIGNTLVVNGATLTIEPGVVVKFDTGKVLQVDGELIAIGTAVNRITFTSSQSTPHAGDWGKIHFADTCVDAVFDNAGNYLSGSIMKYCDVLYGGGIGYGEIHIIQSSPYFNHCNIANSSSNGIYSYHTNYLFDSGIVNNCSDYGLFFNIIECGFRLIGDTIENNVSGGIYLGNLLNCDFALRTKIIKNNYFFSNHNDGAIYSPAFLDSFIISENYFVSNSGFAVIGFAGIDQYIIECNKFYNNQTRCISNVQDYQGEIRNNIFEGNISSIGTSVINTNCSALNFHDNYINNNTATNGSTCRFVTGISTLITLHLNNNLITNNNANSTIYIGGNTSQTNPAEFLSMQNNSFINPNTQYEFYNSVAYGLPNIYADSNYWGGTSNQHMDSIIYDFFDYGNLSVVYYLPILTNPVAIDTTCTASIINGIPEIKQETSSQIFPNPFSDFAVIRFNKSLHHAAFRIYNVYGQVVMGKDNVEGKELLIERGDLPSGFYIYEVLENQSRVGQGKFVIH